VQVIFQQALSDAKERKFTYNVPYCLKQLVKQLREFSPGILIQLYKTSGMAIVLHEDHTLIRYDIKEYKMYFHNHHITETGYLTSMCCIETPFSWYDFKDTKQVLYKWFRDKIFFGTCILKSESNIGSGMVAWGTP